MREQGIHTIPGILHESITGLAVDPGMSREDFAAGVLGRIGETIFEHWQSGGGMIVAYPDIRDTMPGHIAAHFGLTLDAGSVALMAAAAKRDAKTPQQDYVNDVSGKRAAATIEFESAAERWLHPIQSQLNRLAVCAGHGSD